MAGSDAGDWVRRCSAVTSATPPVHAGQCWPTGDLLVLLAGCGSKSCQYRGSRQAIPHGLQLPGELPMPPARRAITLARSHMRAPAFLCRRRADATTFSASTSCPLRYAAMIPRSQQSLPPRRLTSRVVARCAAGEAGGLRLVLGDSGGGAQPSGLPVRVRGRWVLRRGAPLPPAVWRVAWSGVCAPVIGRGWCCVARGGRRPTRGRYSRVRAR